MGTLNSGGMVMHIASAKITVREGNISRYSFYGQMLDCSVCNFQSMNSPMELNSLFSKFFCYITRFVTWHLIRLRMNDLQRPLCFSETIAYSLKITNCINHVFSLIYPVDEFFLKEMRTLGQSKISSYCFYVWC